MKKIILLILVIGFSLGINAQNQTIDGNVNITEKLEAKKLLLNGNNRISNWNSVWQGGLFNSYNATNAPEPRGWFWGLNSNYEANNANRRINGQIAIKQSTTPTMYFRSTAANGTGTWAKLLHDKGNQTIKGSLLLDKPNATSDWNTINQSGFFDSANAANAPEPTGWFWGINFNHRNNIASNRKYNGQIAIKNHSTNPTMYFRSTNVNGTGTWAKLLHSKGIQTIDGDLVINKLSSNHSSIRIGKEKHDMIYADNSPAKTYGGGMFFRVTKADNRTYINALSIAEDGKVGIGTISKRNTAMLTVKGDVHARKVKVKVAAGADFVFDKDYDLPSLESVEAFITKNKHLPTIAPAKEMETNGLHLGEMNIRLLQKVEELTLYTIQQEKRLNSLEEENKSLKTINSKLIELQKRLDRLEKN